MNAIPSLIPAAAPEDRPSGPDDELLTVQEAARFLHVTVSWIYEHVRGGVEDRLPVIKIGKYLRFDRRDLRAYVDAKRAESHRNPCRR